MTRRPFDPASLDLLPGESSRPPLRLLEGRRSTPAGRQRTPPSSPTWSKVLGVMRRAWSG